MAALSAFALTKVRRTGKIRLPLGIASENVKKNAIGKLPAKPHVYPTKSSKAPATSSSTRSIIRANCASCRAVSCCTCESTAESPADRTENSSRAKAFPRNCCAECDTEVIPGNSIIHDSGPPRSFAVVNTYYYYRQLWLNLESNRPPKFFLQLRVAHLNQSRSAVRAGVGHRAVAQIFEQLF